MKRMTSKNLRRACNDPWDYCGLDSVCKRDCFKPEPCKIPKLIDRLAAYEDTGLEPEDILRILDAYGRGMTLRTESAQRLEIVKGIQTDRLRELAQADREGRCVVLPCKVEDDVYINILGRTLPFTVISISQMSSTPTFKAQHGIRLVYIFKADDVGETVFMTRAEAEAALKGEQEEKR